MVGGGLIPIWLLFFQRILLNIVFSAHPGSEILCDADLPVTGLSQIFFLLVLRHPLGTHVPGTTTLIPLPDSRAKYAYPMGQKKSPLQEPPPKPNANPKTSSGTNPSDQRTCGIRIRLSQKREM